jgi:hypothetical protein
MYGRFAVFCGAQPASDSRFCVCVYMYILYMCVYLCMCVYVCMYTWIIMHSCIVLHVFKASVCVCIHMHMHIYAHIGSLVCFKSVRMHNMHMHMHSHAYAHICIYRKPAHTHTRECTWNHTHTYLWHKYPRHAFMRVCLYIYVILCMYSWMCPCMHKRTSMNAFVYLCMSHAFMRVFVYLCMSFLYMYAWMCPSTHSYMYAWMHSRLQYCHSHNNWGPRNSFQRLVVPVVDYWKIVETPETDPQLLWE